MEKEPITRREAITRLGLGILSLGVLSSLPIACKPTSQNKHTDQSNLRIPCDDCTTCIPCPYGIDIRQNIRVYNQACDDGILPDPRQKGSKQYAHEGEALIKALNRQVPRLAQADRCIGCNKCADRCQHHLPIPQTMRQIENLTSRVQEDLFDQLCKNGIFKI